jgi:hypothetical protein
MRELSITDFVQNLTRLGIAVVVYFARLERRQNLEGTARANSHAGIKRNGLFTLFLIIPSYFLSVEKRKIEKVWAGPISSKV